jgi:hypothetical protein
MKPMSLRSLVWGLVVAFVAFTGGIVVEKKEAKHRDVAAMIVVVCNLPNTVVFVKGDGRIEHHRVAPDDSPTAESDMARLTPLPKKSKLGFFGECPKQQLKVY